MYRETLLLAVVRVDEPPGLVLVIRVIDADTRGGAEVHGVLALSDEQGVARQVGTVVLAGDCERLAEFAGAVCQSLCVVTKFAHLLFAFNRDDAPNQDAFPGAFGLRHSIHVPVHAVDEVDVGVPTRAKHDLVSLGLAAEGVGGVVCGAQVALGLGYLADQGGTAQLLGKPAVQVAADQVLRDLQGVPFIEGAGKYQAGHSTMLRGGAHQRARPCGSGGVFEHQSVPETHAGRPAQHAALALGLLASFAGRNGTLEDSMTRVVVNGVGKLGRAIVAAAAQSDAVQVVAGVDSFLDTIPGLPVYPALDQVSEEFDVIVDASRADGLQTVLPFAVGHDKSLVIAATGHTDDQLQQLAKAAESIPVFRATNLSVGVNVVRALTEQAGRMLGPVDAEIIETHHRMKVDAPSGTALTLAETLRDATDPGRPFVYGRTPEDDHARGNEIGIHAVRGGTVVGEHTVRFLMDDEVVEIKHVALSRQVFGFGAVRAAEFIAYQPPGLYGMPDLLAEN